MSKTHYLANLRRGVRGLAAAAVVLALPAFSASAATPAPAPASVVAPAVATPDQYRIGAGDTLHITVYQSPDLSIDARVNEAGVISYPLLGRVALGGLTVNAAELHLAQALKKGEIVKDPQVIIAVTNVRANQVNVLGQVGHPGRLPLDLAGMHLTEVIALAGGVNNGAGSDTIVLIGQRGGRPFRHEADLPKIFAPGGSNDDIVVMPGDTIWVDRAPQIYLYGEIQHPGIQRLERGMEPVNCQAAWRDGRIKQAIMRKVLGLRQTAPALFTHGDYVPLAIEGTLEDNIVTFSRQYEGKSMIVVVPRLTHRLLAGGDRISLDPGMLQGNSVTLPASLQGRHFHSLLAGDDDLVAASGLSLQSVLGALPVAVLYAE